MGLDWDPDGDSERRKDARNRMLLTVAIVLAVLAFVGKYLYQQHEQAERERELRNIQELNQQLRQQRGF